MTTLYVTHDQMEALTMSDKVAVMQGGISSKKLLPKLYLPRVWRSTAPPG